MHDIDLPPSTPPAVAALIGGDAALRAIFGEVRARMATDAAHDVTHLLRVADWTLRLLPDARREAGEPVEVHERLARLGVAAALLHDVVNVPKHSPDRARASERSADVVHALLPSLGFDEAEVALVADAVRDHSYTRGAVPTTPLGRALQDADRLEAVGALGVLRCVATGVHGGAALFDPDDPWAARRALDERRFSIDHFQTKLLRLPGTLLTAAGRDEAARRAAAMVALLAQLGDELGVVYAGIGG